MTEQGNHALTVKGYKTIEEAEAATTDSEQIVQNQELLNLHEKRKKVREGENLLALLPQGEGSGLNADLLDGLHAREIIEKITYKVPTGPTFGGGGGGLTQHGNEFHTPDFSEVTHNHNLNDLTEKLHASLAGVTANQHHNQLHNLASADHPDVSIAAPADTEVLTFEGATSLWKNKPAAGGGGKEYATKLVGFSATCDYVCDGAADDVQINQAIAAVVALGGGTVELQRGTYDIDSSILMDTNVWLRGQGYDTHLVAHGAITRIVYINIKSYVQISDLHLNTNSTVTVDAIYCLRGTYVHLHNLYITGMVGTATYSYAIQIRGTDASNIGSYIKIYNNIIVGTVDTGYALGVYVDSYNKYVDVYGNLFSGGGQQLSVKSSYSTVNGNVCQGQQTNEAVLAITIGTYNTISNNVIANSVKGTSSHGINCGATYATMSGNTIYNVGGDGIRISGVKNAIIANSIAVTVAYAINISASDQTVTGNKIYSAGKYGIYINNVARILVVGNSIDSYGVAGANSIGIYLAYATFCNVTGNSVTNLLNTATATYGVYLDNACSDNLIADNLVDNAKGYGIYHKSVATCARNRFRNNIMTTCTTAPFFEGALCVDTMFDSVIVPFVTGYDIQQSGILVDGEEDYADTWTMLPTHVQQVIRGKVYARAAIAETHSMEADFEIYGAADNEAYTTHNGSAASLASTSVNFAADDVIYWTLSAAGLLAMTGKDSIQVRIDGAAADGDNCATNAYIRTVEIEYV